MNPQPPATPRRPTAWVGKFWQTSVNPKRPRDKVDLYRIYLGPDAAEKDAIATVAVSHGDFNTVPRICAAVNAPSANALAARIVQLKTERDQARRVAATFADINDKTSLSDLADGDVSEGLEEALETARAVRKALNDDLGPGQAT